MNVKTKKSSVGKLLALVASLSMVIAGLSAIAFASPASAGEKVWICHYVSGNGEFKAHYNLIDVSENSNHVNDSEDKPANWDGEGTEQSDYSCPSVPDEPNCDSNDDQSGELTYRDGGEEGGDKDPCVNPCDDQSDAVVYRDGEEGGNVVKDPCVNPCDEVVLPSSERSGENQVECPSDPTGDAWLNCYGDWEASISGAKDEAKVRVLIDGNSVDLGENNETDDNGDWSGYGYDEYLGEGSSHDIQVQVKVKGQWTNVDGAYDDVNCEYNPPVVISETCSEIVVDYNDADPYWIWLMVGDYSYDGNVDEDAGTVTFPLEGTSVEDWALYYGETWEPFATGETSICPPTGFSATSGLVVQACVAGAPQSVSVVGFGTGATEAGAIASAQNNAGTKAAAQVKALGGTAGPCPGVTPVPPVVAPAVVAPAVVAPAKPAKKPVQVAAPGSVSAGVATVATPAKATLPASVPAGDGSQAPALPLWALALVAVGILGAAATGKQLLGARK